MYLALVSILLNAIAQITIKSLAGTGAASLLGLLRHWQLYATGALYGLSIITWYLALKSLPLNLAYPMQALGYILVTLFSWFFFQETLTLVQILALAIIVFGVLLLAFGGPR